MFRLFLKNGRFPNISIGLRKPCLQDFQGEELRMREEKNTKNRKWLWPVIVVAAVLVIAGTLLGIFWSDIFGGNAGAMQASDLYWNLDRLTFVDPDTGMSTRVKGDDGYFHIRFVYNGEIVEKKVIGDKKLVNYIETLDVMGLILDANGIVLDVAEPKTFKTEIAKSFYVRDASQAFLRLNANKAMNGGLLTVALNDSIGIYDMSIGLQVVFSPTFVASVDIS